MLLSNNQAVGISTAGRVFTNAAALADADLTDATDYVVADGVGTVTVAGRAKLLALQRYVKATVAS